MAEANPESRRASDVLEHRVLVIVMDHDGRILFGQYLTGDHKPGLYGLPMGRVEAGEEPLAAVPRETGEETLLTVRPLQNQYWQVPYPEESMMLHVAIACVCKGSAPAGETREMGDLKRARRAEILQHGKLHPRTRVALEDPAVRFGIETLATCLNDQRCRCEVPEPRQECAA